MISPWIIIAGLIFVIVLLWLVWPREYLDYSDPPVREICDANPSSVHSEHSSFVQVPFKHHQPSPVVEKEIDSPQPDQALLSDYVPPSPYPMINTGELRQRVNDRIGPAITTIINNPNPRTGKFVSRGQQICRLTMEAIYGVPFTEQRPSWLVNPETGHLLELDCYNEDLKLAVEYNGKQHYHYDETDKGSFHRSQSAFEASLRRDSYKKKLCREHHVFLITVPYTINNRDIPNFIVSFLPEVIRQRSKGTVDELTESIHD
jgi:hypothetical protein